MPRTTNDTKRRAQMLVLAPVMAMALGAVVSLTSDVGQMAVTQAKLQNTADAAALAALNVLLTEYVGGTEDETARDYAQAEGVAIQQINHPAAGSTIEFGVMDDGDFVPVSVGTAATAVRATAYRNDDAPGGPLPMLFASIIGVSACELSGTAVCEFSSFIRGVVGNLSPFAVPEDKIPGVGGTMVFYPAEYEDDEGLGDETTVSGNWGLLNLDGGENSAEEVIDWILNGFDGEIILGEDGCLWVEGTPGFKTSMKKAVEDRIGDALIMVIFDEVVDGGSNASYRCVGFLLATITECKLTGNDPHITCQIVGIAGIHDIVTGGTYPSPNLRKVQLIR